MSALLDDNVQSNKLLPVEMLTTISISHTGWWDRVTGFKQQVGYMAQGEQRALDKTGRVFPLKEPNQHVLVSC